MANKNYTAAKFKLRPTMTRSPIAALFLTGVLVGVSYALSAATYVLPPLDESLVGRIRYAKTSAEDTLADIARQYDIGRNEIILANPDVDPWLPGKATRILLPTRYVLPNAPRQGIVINIPEMRLYYYPKRKNKGVATVMTYPISVGRRNWETPLALTRITQKKRDPSWTPPESVREEHAADGDPLPKIVPPGPDNPLGLYALRLGIPGYLIHGTNKPYGIGMRVTHGCVRLYPRDIETLFNSVPTGVQVRFVNQPVKLGRYLGELYVEAHPQPGTAERVPQHDDLTPFLRKSWSLIQSHQQADQPDFHRLEALVKKSNGVPLPVIQAYTKAGADLRL